MDKSNKFDFEAALKWTKLVSQGLQAVNNFTNSGSSKNDALMKDFQNELNSTKTSYASDLKSRDQVIAQKDAEIKELRERLAQALQEISGLKQDNKKLRSEINGLKSKIDELQVMVGNLLKDNQELRLQNEKILKQNAETNETNRLMLMQIIQMQKGAANQMSFQNG